jgi:hypothetical protein
MSKIVDLYNASKGAFKTIPKDKDETPYSKGGSDSKTLTDGTFGQIDFKTGDKEVFTEKSLNEKRGGTIGAMPASKLPTGFVAPAYSPGDKIYSKVVTKK